MQTASQLYKGRLLKGAVPEAAQYPRALCNQHCKTHLYFKNGVPYDQATGKQHDCIMTRIAKMFIGHYRMIKIARIVDSPMIDLPQVIASAEEFCRKWSLAFDKWKATGIVPTSEEVEGY